MIESTNDQLQNVIKSIKNVMKLKIFIFRIEHFIQGFFFVSLSLCYKNLIYRLISYLNYSNWVESMNNLIFKKKCLMNFTAFMFKYKTTICYMF